MTVAERIDAEEVLREALRQYAGEWVAIARHRVVAHAPSLEQLVERAAAKGDEVEIVQVADDSLACFY